MKQHRIKPHQFVPAPRVIARLRRRGAPIKIPASSLALASLPALIPHSSVPVCESPSPQPYNRSLSLCEWSRLGSQCSSLSGKILSRLLLKVTKCCPFEKKMCLLWSGTREEQEGLCGQK